MPEKSSSKSRSKSKSGDERRHKSSSSKSHGEKAADAPVVAVPSTPQTITKPAPVADGAVCDNCSQVASCYCGNCDALLCDACFSSLHGNVALGGHVKIQGALVGLFTKKCTTHGRRSRFYCATCGVQCCEQCKAQIHSGLGHRVTGIQEAFYERVNQIQALIQSNLQPKQIQIQTDLLQFQAAEQKLQAAEDSARARVQNEAERLLQNLARAKAQKAAAIQADHQRLQRAADELREIQEALAQVCCSGSISSASGMNLSHSLSSLPLQTVQQNVETPVFDVLKNIEIKARHLCGEDLSHAVAALEGFDPSLPDELMITKQKVEAGNMLAAKTQQLALLEAESTNKIKAYEEELQKWMALTQNYADSLRDHFLECAFCGCKMTKEAANAECLQNSRVEKGSYDAVKRAEKIIERDGAISVEDAVAAIGTARHYWVSGAGSM